MIAVDLSGKTILITGALGAIAEHVVRRLRDAGATLLLLDIQEEGKAAEKLAEWQISPSRYQYFAVDITDSAALESVVQKCFERHPSLDTVIGHAGGCGLHPFATTDEAKYERIFKFNYFAQTYLARAVLQWWMASKIAGHLMFTSSYVARVPHTQIPAYASAKAALENFAKCVALEYAETGIRVNVLSPGNVAAGSSLKVYEEDAAYREHVKRVSPTGRRNSPEAIGDAFVFLCSPLARELNGQILSVDLGVGIGNRL
jgi:NAD(P)-dependent dehydrogenase (short-subunit alcohol dehydrogenase family)